MNLTRHVNVAAPRRIKNARLALVVHLMFVCALASAAPAQTFTLLYQFRSGPGGINPYAGVVRDASGTLYGTTYNDGAFASGTVFKINGAKKRNRPP